jgi:hypothetical protein
MKAAIQTIIVVLMLLLVGARADAVFLDSVLSKSAMTRVPFDSVGAVAIRVEDPRDDAEKAGLSKEALTSYIELRLRERGIPVRDPLVTTKESPYVYLNVNITYLNDIDHYIFRAELSLRQTVMLLRNGKLVQATTWDNAIHGICRSDRITGNVTGTIDRLLDMFVDQYLQANPKR